ncbi:MAG: DNA recombination protein RmuC [Candidatus Fermentibacteraceae bacterium]|nr:DNA recombination protein RmuC [Candidatus Fermentibacteraceae bacterium]
MDPLLCVVLAAVFFAAGWIVHSLKSGDGASGVVRLETQLKSEMEKSSEYRKTAEKLENELESLRTEERAASQNLRTAEAKLAAGENYLNDVKTRLRELTEKLEQREADFLELKGKFDRLETSLEEKELHFRQQLKLLLESKEELKLEFKELAAEIFENSGKKFKEINRESIVNLLNPVEKEMKGFRESVESLSKKDSIQRAELKTEVINLQKLNQKITQEAHNLTTALQGQKKMQGNWGEMILENVLDSSGLRLGADYRREKSFATDEGRQRPDAIIYLPGGRHIVIDAKTSLAAYTEFVNAEDPVQAKVALSRHAKAVSDRIKELAERDYFKIDGLNTPEVVIMFIPIESAYVEALKHDPDIFQKALLNNVLVATPTTLLTTLNIVKQLWRFEEQTKHTKELASRAEKFYDKLRVFLESMTEIGHQIDKTQTIYNKAVGQLVSGKGNLIKKAAEFKDLGVSVTKTLPADLVEKASLELESADGESST